MKKYQLTSFIEFMSTSVLFIVIISSIALFYNSM